MIYKTHTYHTRPLTTDFLRGLPAGEVLECTVSRGIQIERRHLKRLVHHTPSCEATESTYYRDMTITVDVINRALVISTPTSAPALAFGDDHIAPSLEAWAHVHLIPKASRVLTPNIIEVYRRCAVAYRTTSREVLEPAVASYNESKGFFWPLTHPHAGESCAPISQRVLDQILTTGV